MFRKSFLKYCLELLRLQDKDKKKELIQGHVAWLFLALCEACTDLLGFTTDTNFIMLGVF